MSSDTKGAGSRSSGFTGQSVQKVAAGGASESGWAVSADFVVCTYFRLFFDCAKQATS